MEGKYYLLNAGYGRALAFVDGRVTHLEPQASVADSTRIWKLEKPDVDAAQTSAETTYYNIVPVDNLTLGLELQGGSPGDNTPIVLAKKANDRNAQQWSLQARGKKGGVLNYLILNRNVKEAVIRVVGQSFNDPANTIRGWTESTTDSFQGWFLIPVLKQNA